MNNIFEENILNLYKETGKAWLETLPNTIHEIAVLWNLSDLTPLKNLTYHFVLSGMQNEQPVILKLSPDAESLKKEAAALKAFSGYGTVPILASSEAALLLERALPGHTLKTLFPNQDEKAISIACQLIERLHQAPIPMHSKFPLLETELQILDQPWNLPASYLQKARNLRNDLLKSTTHTVLLHGDLHHDNILSHQNHWLAIDPKGVIGDPLYDKIGCLIREPLFELLQQDNILQILNHRVHWISNYFKLDALRILHWSFVQSILACCWCLEDHQDPKLILLFLENLIKILNSHENH